jgi:endo-1,4-beta-xylanase
MKRVKKFGIIFITIGCITLISFGLLGYFAPPAVYNIQLNTPLKNASRVPIGVAIDTYHLSNNETYRNLIILHFNSIVAEWQMKMNVIYPKQNEYSWNASDYIANFSQTNHMILHGHALLWHQSTPDWVTQFNGTNEEFELIVKNYIQTVVSRYKGIVQSWDVVNEAFLDSGYRDTIFYQRMGVDYLKKAFIWAHEADPTVKLYYNDFSLLGNPQKINLTIHEITKLVNESVPIHGIGIQGHINSNSPNLITINQSLQQWNALGLEIRISELDIAMNPKGYFPRFSQQIAELQKIRYHDVVSLFMKCPRLTGITLWGLSDAYSWIPSFQGHTDWPLLFDDNFKPKPAVLGFLTALQET